jgi:protocatechuate 3,4-dioxygenase, beta subunit
MTFSRRAMLKTTISTMGLLGAASAFGRIDKICTRTPVQPEGPFYPVIDQTDKDTDLTSVKGRSGRAQGELIYVQGVVTDPNCEPINNAVVEIWQACASGRYDHPGDQENSNPLDPNFQYWGISATNERGQYQFKTIIPGHYSAGEGWIRPPHIHFKVHCRGYFELITQMYFSGNQYNDADLILKRLSDAEKSAVIVNLIPRQSPSENAQECFFNITLRPVR